MKPELMRDLQAGVRLHAGSDSSINPEILAMHDALVMRTDLSPEEVKELTRMMAMAAEHYQAGVRTKDAEDWIKIGRWIVDARPQVPRNLARIPKSWQPVFAELVTLYGDPNAESV